MYKLDSGFISIIAAIAAIAIGIYSAVNDKRKWGQRRDEAHDSTEADDLSEGNSSIKVFDNPFEGLFSAFKDEEQSQAQKQEQQNAAIKEAEEDERFAFARRVDRARAEAPVTVVMPSEKMKQGLDFEPYSSMEEGIKATVENESFYEIVLESLEASEAIAFRLPSDRPRSATGELLKPSGEAEDSLKERIRKSPKDLVLFSEILQPRYKNF